MYFHVFLYINIFKIFNALFLFIRIEYFFRSCPLFNGTWLHDENVLSRKQVVRQSFTISVSSPNPPFLRFSAVAQNIQLLVTHHLSACLKVVLFRKKNKNKFFNLLCVYEFYFIFLFFLAFLPWMLFHDLWFFKQGKTSTCCQMLQKHGSVLFTRDRGKEGKKKKMTPQMISILRDELCNFSVCSCCTTNDCDLAVCLPLLVVTVARFLKSSFSSCHLSLKFCWSYYTCDCILIAVSVENTKRSWPVQNRSDTGNILLASFNWVWKENQIELLSGPDIYAYTVYVYI